MNLCREFLEGDRSKKGGISANILRCKHPYFIHRKTCKRSGAKLYIRIMAAFVTLNSDIQLGGVKKARLVLQQRTWSSIPMVTRGVL